ncbi:MAG: hypothetical protein V5A43_00590 [Haloarculaceae archaeon]
MHGNQPDSFTALQRVVVPFGLGAVLMAAMNLLVLEVLQGQYPGVSAAYIRACASPLFAAVQEPLTSKLLPAIFVLAWTRRLNQAAWLRTRWATVAAGGGLVVGALELVSKLARGPIQLSVVPPVVLHVLTATIVGWAVFRTAGRRRTVIDLHLVVLAVGLAVSVHLGWSRFVWPALTGGLPC